MALIFQDPSRTFSVIVLGTVHQIKPYHCQWQSGGSGKCISNDKADLLLSESGRSRGFVLPTIMIHFSE
jgi:hypothetical protein